MAVTVNLREVFPSDSQSNLTEKLNFNFNQLLTLGLGQPGPKGDKGDAGPIGPVGPVGGAGARGSKIYAVQTDAVPVDVQGPAAGSVTGDAFINTKKIFIKGLNGVPTNWDQVVDFQAIIGAQSLQDPYKAFQIGLGSGDTGSKHGIFFRYNGVDSNNTGLASSNPYYPTQTTFSTQLILSNFDVTKTYRISGTSLVANTAGGTTATTDAAFEYTALQKIIAFLPSTLTNYRHQLELGSLDELAITVGGGSQQYVLTPTEQNLKFRKYRVSSSSLANGVYNRSDLDMSGIITSSNSVNGEIVLAVNKKVSSTVNRFEMGLSVNPILAIRVPSAQLKTDGLIISRDGTSHVTFGFDSDSTTSLRLQTTSDLTTIKIKDTNFTWYLGNLVISQDDPTKTTGLGSAVIVKNNRLAAGIAFPAAQVSSTDANTLDDYSEGTWGNTNGSGKVYLWKSVCNNFMCSTAYPIDITSALGVNTTNVFITHKNNYTKIGNQVTIIFYYELNSYLIFNSAHEASFSLTTSMFFEGGDQYTVPTYDEQADLAISLPYPIKSGTPVSAIVTTYAQNDSIASPVKTAQAIVDPVNMTNAYNGSYVKLSVATEDLYDTAPSGTESVFVTGTITYFTA